MTGDQIVFLSATFVLILGTSVLAQFHWLPRGKFGQTLVFIAGSASMISLRLAKLPPSWFDASASSFTLALTLSASAFLGRTDEERSFRVPFLLGIGLSLLIINIIAFAEAHL
ncbi:MAG TPA: hypothetical protein VJZ00_21850 [Thermoanaerobaculia bacterium]|nr:hypothetical protein [Thermoanaerobaculia bacterium]